MPDDKHRTSAAEPVAGAVVMLADTEKKAASALTGEYRLVEVRPGWYNILVLANGKE